MIAKDSVEQAYSFFHQKWRVYSNSTDETQRDDIEYAISSYVALMSEELYSWLSQGRKGWLVTHSTFSHDMKESLAKLESCVTQCSEH